ncbi:MAG: hypothetical protein A3F41_03130 [Coxiella sp. RIFCSPHIGHO2_12_FULL_44_14]|nr:MAG: hypothetical protein A3F41_03130 [Coxiella sp. RIFCSPHIGHO2_12_FULL_44_14]
MSFKVATVKESASPQQLAQNLNILFKNHHSTASQVAHAVDIPMMTVRRLLSGETVDPRISTLKLIADHFGVTVDSLMGSNSQVLINSLTKTKLLFVPILNWNMAEGMNTIIDFDLTQWTEWQPISLSENEAIGKHAFALESRPSMYPRFPQGTVFVIDPDVIPADGDIVLVKIKKNDELALRELVIDPPDWRLHSLIFDSNVLQYSKRDHEIVGVNLLTLLYNRRN